MILWFPNFRFVWSPGNYDVRRRGAEFSATVNRSDRRPLAHGSVSDAAVEYRGPVLSGQVAYRPRYTANAPLLRSALGFRGTVRYRYIGRRRTIAASDLNTLDPFAVTDLQVARRIAPSRASMSWRIGLDDVFDRAGTMLIDYPLPAGSGVSHSGPCRLFTHTIEVSMMRYSAFVRAPGGACHRQLQRRHTEFHRSRAASCKAPRPIPRSASS